jgi:hypothetical protein
MQGSYEHGNEPSGSWKNTKSYLYINRALSLLLLELFNLS